MFSIPFLAVTEKAQTSVLDAIPHLAGMLMVMVTLAILWGVCAFTAKLIQLLLPVPAPAAAPVAAALPQPAGRHETNTIAPEIVAVIAAAVAATTGSRQRIVSIKSGSSAWERAGRHSVLSSHRIR